MTKLPKNYEGGQTILVILLIMAVVLTIGLSAISSSITDVKISQETEEASRAYYVAESAIEEQIIALGTPTGVVSGQLGGVTYNVTKTEKGGAQFLFPNKVEAGDAQTLWLVAHDGSDLTEVGRYTGASFYVKWNDDAAVIVDLVYKQGADYKIFRQNCDSNSSRAGSNHFTLVTATGSTIEGVSLKYSCQITPVIPAGAIPYLARITPLYNPNPISVGILNDGTNPFPKQGDCFDSKATVDESGVTRRISQCKLWPDIPNIFTWGLFSGEGDLEKPI